MSCACEWKVVCLVETRRANASHRPTGKWAQVRVCATAGIAGRRRQVVGGLRVGSSRLLGREWRPPGSGGLPPPQSRFAVFGEPRLCIIRPVVVGKGRRKREGAPVAGGACACRACVASPELQTSYAPATGKI